MVRSHFRRVQNSMYGTAIRGKQADINCTNSTFRNCNNFIDVEISEIYMDKCGVYNCISKFICTKVDYMSGVGQSQITNTLIVIDDPQALELAKVYDEEKAVPFLNGVLNAIATVKGLKETAVKDGEEEA